MRKFIIFNIVAILASSCSGFSPIKQRAPAQEIEGNGCFQMARVIVGNYSPYALKDFPELSYGFIHESELLTRLVKINQLKENQEQTQVILALLKKKNPTLSSNELAKKYAQVMSECS